MNGLDDLKSAVAERSAQSGPKRRRYELLAEELRSRITRGDLKVGEPLPAERDLVDLSGLGRGSVREAIRILEIEGLLSPKKAGRNGMSVVQNASDQTISRQLELVIGGDSVSNDQLLEARVIIEPALARLAAQNRIEADIERLRAINEAIAATSVTEVETLVALNLDWHVALFRSSRNDLMTAIASGLVQTQHHAKVLAQNTDDIQVDEVVVQHDRILQAVIDRDADLAHARTLAHLDSYRDTLHRLNPDQVDLPPVLAR